MATIYKEFLVNASPEFVWQAIKDVGSIHMRLAQGFVTDTVLTGDMRTVTFSNGLIVQEQIISANDDLRRLAYTSVGGRASHHNAYFQVFESKEETSRILWVTDFLPEGVSAPIAQMVEIGTIAIKQTLEKNYLLRQ